MGIYQRLRTFRNCSVCFHSPTLTYSENNWYEIRKTGWKHVQALWTFFHTLKHAKQSWTIAILLTQLKNGLPIDTLKLSLESLECQTNQLWGLIFQATPSWETSVHLGTQIPRLKASLSTRSPWTSTEPGAVPNFGESKLDRIPGWPWESRS